MPDLKTETDELVELRKLHTGDHVTELDKRLEGLVLCDSLSICTHSSSDLSWHSCQQSGSTKRSTLSLRLFFRSGLKRISKWGKNVYYNANYVKEKIRKQRERVRDAQDKFVVRYSCYRCSVPMLNSVVGEEHHEYSVGNEGHE